MSDLIVDLPVFNKALKGIEAVHRAAARRQI